MLKILCKFCGSANSHLEGNPKVKQWYKCNCCGKKFSEGDGREKISQDGKILSALLYGSGKMSYESIGDLLGVSHVATHNCIKKVNGRFSEPISNNSLKKLAWAEIMTKINGINRKESGSEYENANRSKKENEKMKWILFEINPSKNLTGLILLKSKNKSSKDN